MDTELSVGSQQRTDLIKEIHGELMSLGDELVQGAQLAMAKVFKLGTLLRLEKEQRPGKFTAWVNDALPFDDRQARRYMAVETNRALLEPKVASGEVMTLRQALVEIDQPVDGPDTRVRNVDESQQDTGGVSDSDTELFPEDGEPAPATDAPPVEVKGTVQDAPADKPIKPQAEIRRDKTIRMDGQLMRLRSFMLLETKTVPEVQRQAGLDALNTLLDAWPGIFGVLTEQTDVPEFARETIDRKARERGKRRADKKR